MGFFHPFWYVSGPLIPGNTQLKYVLTPRSNAGGGGERVLWAAIRATQNRWPKAKCIVYTGDHDVTKDEIISRVKVGDKLLNNPHEFDLHIFFWHQCAKANKLSNRADLTLHCIPQRFSSFIFPRGLGFWPPHGRVSLFWANP